MDYGIYYYCRKDILKWCDPDWVDDKTLFSRQSFIQHTLFFVKAEAICLCGLLLELWTSYDRCTLLSCDNQTAVAFDVNSMSMRVMLKILASSIYQLLSFSFYQAAAE